MKKIKNAEPEYRRMRSSKFTEVCRHKHSADIQQCNSTPAEHTARGQTLLSEDSPPGERDDSVVFPPFPFELVRLSPTDFMLPDEYITDHKNELTCSELMSLSPNIPFGKQNKNNSDLADTVPVECVPTSLLQMSPENNDCNLLDTRAVSPILLCKPTIVRSHLYSRRMKSLNTSVRSKRSIPKQIPLVLDHKFMTKINENLPELTQMDGKDWEKGKEVSVSEIDEKKEKMAELSRFESDVLKASNGEVVAVFCEHEVLIVVQQSVVTFMPISEERNSVREVARVEVTVDQIFTWTAFNYGFTCACLEMLRHSSGVALVVYTYNQHTGICSAHTIQFQTLPLDVTNIKMCSVPGIAFVMCWSKDSNVSTLLVKHTLDEHFQKVLKTTQLEAVNGCVNSLHSLRGCQKVLLGESISEVTIWDLHSGLILKRVDYDGLMWSLYLWCDEDKGYLFSAVAIDKDIVVIAANLTTGRFKLLRRLTVPEPFSQLCAAYVDRGFIVATYLEGLIVWQLGSSREMMKVVIDGQLFLSKSTLVYVAPGGDLKVLDVLANVSKKQHFNTK